jgi:precorrin-6B methylase 2
MKAFSRAIAIMAARERAEQIRRNAEQSRAEHAEMLANYAGEPLTDADCMMIRDSIEV